MTALDCVIALARGYERMEHGKLQEVSGYSREALLNHLSDLHNYETSGVRLYPLSGLRDLHADEHDGMNRSGVHPHTHIDPVFDDEFELYPGEQADAEAGDAADRARRQGDFHLQRVLKRGRRGAG